MAKLFLIIVCVCYCTTCIHLIAAKLAGDTKEFNQPSNAYDSNASNDLNTNVNTVSTQSLTSAEQSDIITKHTHRVKRHGTHDHHSTNIKLDSFVDINPNTKEFIKKIFREYGNGEAETMNFNEFERMLEKLGLYRMLEKEHLDNAHAHDGHDHHNDKVNIIYQLANCHNNRHERHVEVRAHNELVGILFYIVVLYGVYCAECTLSLSFLN